MLPRQARGIHEAGDLDPGAARDVHGHERHGREPGRDDQQVGTNLTKTDRKDSAFLLLQRMKQI